MYRSRIRAYFGWLVVLALLVAGSAIVWRRAREAYDEHGTTALMRAARDGRVDEVERLLDAGADVRAAVKATPIRDLIAFLSWMQERPHRDVGYTALHYAAASGHVEAIEMLAEAGAPLDALDRDGGTPLDAAVMHDRVEAAERLLALRATSRGQSLGMAIHHDRPELLAALLRAGAKPESWHTNPRDVTLLHVAAIQGRAACARVLLEHGLDPDVRDGRGFTALRVAVDAGHEAVAEVLRGAGADEGAVHDQALVRALWEGGVDAVRAALASGADANARDDIGRPALAVAAGRGDLASVQALLEAGASVNASREGHGTALHAAAEQGRVEVARALLAAGADANAADRVMGSALDRAAMHGRGEMVELLLASGARAGNRAFDYAASGGHAGVVDSLVRAGARPSPQSLRLAAQRGDLALVMQLVAAGADPGHRTEDGETALHRGTGNVEIVRYLIEQGADVNVRWSSEWTPLHIAAACGHVESVRALLAAGADPNARDSDGKTPLASARNYPEVQDALRAAGGR